MPQNLLPRFADIVRDTIRFDLSDSTETNPILLETLDIRGKRISMVYAPFDHLNTKAKIAIVGMTPGSFQADQAHRAAGSALREGKSLQEAGRAAKVHASFSGEPMRTNLIRMMDAVGIASFLGLGSTASLWSVNSDIVHFTSALRYPVFVDGKNWSGSPDIVRTPRLRAWLREFTGEELGTLRDCLIVPLGPKVGAAMDYLAEEGVIDGKWIMHGLPHPSGANQERIACFLGDKAGDRCSNKTNVSSIMAGRDRLIAKVLSLQQSG